MTAAEPEPTVAIEPATGAWLASTVVIDDVADVPVVDPEIGPELRAARERLRLSIDQLAERTRIRPHVIEAIEIDDFVPCGGDFYARGHLRTLARVLGVDVAPLLATYDKQYADAPIDPRRVFEAELATGRDGSIRGHPRRPELVGPGRRGDGRRARLVDRPAGHGPPAVGHPGPAEPRQRLGRPDQRRRARGPGRRCCSPPPAAARTSWSATVAAGSSSPDSLAFGESQTLQGLPAGPGPVQRRLARGHRRRPGARRPRQDRPDRPGRFHCAVGRSVVSFGADR